MRLREWLGAFGLVTVGFSGVAFADIQDRFVGDCAVGRPASALIFPLVDSRENKGTLITVTNTNSSRTFCGGPGGFRAGDICLAFTFFGRDPNNLDDEDNFCLEFDFEACLTPGDTLTLIADQAAPTMEVGWLWVEARDPETRQAVDFDYLIGSALVADLDLEVIARYVPYGFRALPQRWGPWSSGAVDRCDRPFTDDVGDGDGQADFDGVEYDFWPAKLLLDNFFEEGGSQHNFVNTLALASCDVDPHDDDEGTVVNTFVWNNNEVRFSRGFHFECFFLGSLGDITPIAGDLRGDPNELVTNSGAHLETGWVEFNPDDALLGVFITRISGTCFGGGDVLQMVGQFGGPNDPANSDGNTSNDHDPCELPRFF